MSEANKQTVLAFYEAAFNAKDFEAALDLVGDRYVQHSPLIADGVDGLRARLAQLKDLFPDLRVEVKKLVAEGDHVVAHVHGVRSPGDLGIALVDIFRLADGKLVEHWDLRQEITEESLNGNGVF